MTSSNSYYGDSTIALLILFLPLLVRLLQGFIAIGIGPIELTSRTDEEGEGNLKKYQSLAPIAHLMGTLDTACLKRRKKEKKNILFRTAGFEQA